MKQIKMRVLFLTSFIVFAIQSYSQTNTKPYDRILWIGLENPLLFEDSLTVNPVFKSGDVNVTKVSRGHFIINVTNMKIANQIIQIDWDDALSNDTNKIISNYYLVKQVPNPTFSIAGKLIHDSISRSDLLKSKAFDVRLDDVDFKYNLPFEIVSFDMEIDGKEFHSNSKYLTTSMIYYITHTSGSKIRIMNDKVVMKSSGSDGEERWIYKDKTFMLTK